MQVRLHLADVMGQHQNKENPTLDDILAADSEARDFL